MSIIKKIKRAYYGFIALSETEKWRSLAIELNEELQATRRERNTALERCYRLEKLVDCYGDLKDSFGQ